MPIYDIYSRQKRRAEQTEPDVYQYDRIPRTLRVQIEHIWNDSIGPYYDPGPDYEMGSTPTHNNAAWRFIRHAVCREKGRLSLVNETNSKTDCIGYLHQEENVDDLFDLVQFSFRYIDRVIGRMEDYKRRELGIKQDPDDAIKELNFRFREAVIG